MWLAVFGVARQTVHTWLRRYGRDGLAGLVDRSSKPQSCPHQMPAVVEARVVELRKAHPGWGPRTIRYHLEREGVVAVPSRSSIYRALLRHNLVDRSKRRKRRSDYKRWERSRAMELWQMDIMGGVRLTDGTELKVVTGIDDHSRFCLSSNDQTVQAFIQMDEGLSLLFFILGFASVILFGMAMDVDGSGSARRDAS